jgi:hypothetical protein
MPRKEGLSSMESRTRERVAADDRMSDDAAEFVRFCYRRRKVGWPELYDEMCAVAGRGLFRGWGPDELSAQGIGFSLFEMPALATLVHRVVAEEHERGSRATVAVVRSVPLQVDEIGVADDAAIEEQPPRAALRLAGAGA